jgi:hypothetical protein
MRVTGEYIKGDLFIDATDPRSFRSLVFSSELTLEFGDQNDRLNLFVGDRLSNSDLKDVVLTLLPVMLNAKSHSLRHFNNAEMLESCLQYKRTGKYN